MYFRFLLILPFILILNLPLSAQHFIDSIAVKSYIQTFNQEDEELYINYIDNAASWSFLKQNIPFFECPDKEIERTYYFRWWTYRKHIKKTTDGFVITEFLPNVPWAGKHNTISCPAGHHFYEGRWLRDAKYLDDYAVFWFKKGGQPRLYSFWAADALYAKYLVDKDKSKLTNLLSDLVKNYEAWETGWKHRHWEDGKEYFIGRHSNGLFFNTDDRDGGELSIAKTGYRPTLNSYMYGDAVALSKIAKMAGKEEISNTYFEKAKSLKKLVQESLWDEKASFFKTLPKDSKGELVNVRELNGYTPWYFNLPEANKGYEKAWLQLMDTLGFYAPYGPTFPEQRHPEFKIAYEGHECQWNGPSWPFATSLTITAMANLLNNYPQTSISKKDYLQLLKVYSESHKLKKDDGQVVCWIDENLNPYTGDWISRTRLKTAQNGTWSEEKGGKERGKDYNHSTYCDLVISGLIGIRPREDNVLEVKPLVPENTWDYFCLQNVFYHNKNFTILYDKTGKKYNKGKGMKVYCDGKLLGSSSKIGNLLLKF